LGDVSGPLTVLPSYAALLAAAHGDPLVALEVGPELHAPPLALGGAVAFVRESQLGLAGVVVLGPEADAAELLTGTDWRQRPGWSEWRSITVLRPLRTVLASLGVRGIGEWDTMSIEPGMLVRRPLPSGVVVERGLGREEARAFVGRHHTARWITPEPVGEEWVAVRDSATGALLGTGLAAYTPSGATRLTSIAVDRGLRGRGLGWAVTQELADLGLERSGAVTLGVDQDNVAGRALYAAMGFRLDHELVSGMLPAPPA
jgi:ribosomal protein S18 acetylase RimI-like enzyme